MASPPALKPNSAPVRAYTLALAQLANVGAKHETAVREAWHTLIEHAAPKEWTLVREYSVSRKGAAPLRLDAVLLDSYRLPHGVIEDKDDKDDLAAGMRAKLKLGYPAKNTLFWQPRRAILVQDGLVEFDYYLDSVSQQLCDVVSRFVGYPEELSEDFERPVGFRDRIPELIS